MGAGQGCPATDCLTVCLPGLFLAGDVRVNWRSGTKPSADVKAGDMISVAGESGSRLRWLWL